MGSNSVFKGLNYRNRRSSTLKKAAAISSVTFEHSNKLQLGSDSSVGIATRYGLDGPGIESRWGGEIFRTGAHPSSRTMDTRSLFRGQSGPARGVESATFI